MSPSTKKRPKNSVAFKVQDEKLQDNIEQPVHKFLEKNQLKMVLKNLSFLRLFKNSNPRIQELHSLVRRCWNSPLKFQEVLLVERNSTVRCEGAHNAKELQEARCSERRLASKKPESMKKPEESKPKLGLREGKKAQQSRAAVPEREQVAPKVPETSRDRRLTTCPGAWERQLSTGDSRVVFLKTDRGDREQLEVADQWVWFEGLPTRIHLPGPRVMCRSSSLRWVKRCCTRFCSASLELPMCHPYRVRRCHCQARVRHGPKPGPELGPRVRVRGLRSQSWGLRQAVLGGPTFMPRKGSSEGEAVDQDHTAAQRLGWMEPLGSDEGRGKDRHPLGAGGSDMGHHPVAWRPQERPQELRLRFSQN